MLWRWSSLYNDGRCFSSFWPHSFPPSDFICCRGTNDTRHEEQVCRKRMLSWLKPLDKPWRKNSALLQHLCTFVGSPWYLGIHLVKLLLDSRCSLLFYEWWSYHLYTWLEALWSAMCRTTKSYNWSYTMLEKRTIPTRVLWKAMSQETEGGDTSHLNFCAS